MVIRFRTTRLFHNQSLGPGCGTEAGHGDDGGDVCQQRAVFGEEIDLRKALDSHEATKPQRNLRLAELGPSAKWYSNESS